MSKLALLLIFPVLIWAQSGSSSISGTVKDGTDAAIAKARVKVTNVDTGIEVETATNEAGLYRAAALVPGTYRVEVDAIGFDHLTRGPLPSK